MLDRFSKADVTDAEAHLKRHTLEQIAGRMRLDAFALMVACDRFGGTCGNILEDVDFEALVDAAQAADEAAQYDHHESVPPGPDPRERFVGSQRPALVAHREAAR